jgi:hypothetical protein
MQHETRKFHIFGNDRHIQAAEDKRQPFSVLRLDACLGAFKEEALKAFVFEDPDHLTSVTQNAPRYKMVSNVKMPNVELRGTPTMKPEQRPNIDATQI